MLTDGEGNVFAADEEGNTIVEAADSSGVVQASVGNIVAAYWDAEGNVVLTGGRAMSSLPMRRATPSSMS